MPPLWVSYRSMTSRFPPFAFVELVSSYNKKNITRWLEDMNFMFSWQEQYLTSERSERVRYYSCHSNIKFIYSRHRVIFSIYCTDPAEQTVVGLYTCAWVLKLLATELQGNRWIDVCFSKLRFIPKAAFRPSSDAELFMSRTYSNLDRPKLTKVRLLIQTSNLIRRT